MQKTVIQKKPLRKILFGDRAFYKMVLMIVVPIIIQNAISNFVNLLDNVMVGRMGTDPMTGVSIANQLIFVFNLTIFGGLGGPGIFVSQYHGANNMNGVRHCFRFKLLFSLVVSAIGIAVFAIGGTPLITLYLSDNSDPARAAATLSYGLEYLRIAIIGLLPFALAQTYAGTLRETGETRIPMFASIIAVFTNLVLNYVLIYGKLGAPAMGVRGAALATVIAHFAEFIIVAVFTHKNEAQFPFAEKLYASMKIPMDVLKKITLKGTPLLVNEMLWSVGMAFITQCYSLRGLDAISAMNITNTVANLFAMVFFSMGNTVGIIIGRTLGANEIEKAKTYLWQLLTFSEICVFVTMILQIAFSGLIPNIYNTEPEVRRLATQFLRVYALLMPMQCIVNNSYFTLRSGGKTMITFVFDSVYTWVINIPVAFCLANFTNMPIVPIYFCVQMTDILKAIIGMVMLKRGAWINNMVSAEE